MKEKKKMSGKQPNKMVCASCGGVFEDILSKCPYCDTLNVKGAEAEYMEKLEDVREDMEELGDVPEAEARKELQKQGKFVGVILVILAGMVLIMVLYFLLDNREEERDVQAEYLWKQQNYPIMDELYEQQKYDELLAFYEKYMEEDCPVTDWEHYELCRLLGDLQHVEEIYLKEQNGQEMRNSDYTTLLYYGWRFKTGEATQFMAAEDEQIARQMIEEAVKEFEEYWELDEEMWAVFEQEMQENEGHISYEFCREYVKEWRSE